ncbi:MAG TPA: Stf0 family sulfotransferase, partial [Sphingomonadaceae bacterium]|nr:Stf0 family sulfotransferase [Sphingomonadaceae bacterium]
LDPEVPLYDVRRMIEGIVTGYEAHFDFPPWEGPPRLPFLLASVPRSGSTYFSHLLWSTGCLGAPLEYCNFEPASPYGEAHDFPARQSEIWHSVLATRTSPNGVFGLKAFPMQMEALGQGNPRLVGEVMRLLLGKGSASKVVQLKRRDRNAHAISYARAILSGIWRQEQERDDRPEPEYSEVALRNATKLIEQQEAAWQAMHADLKLDPLVLWFEDVLEDPSGAVGRVASYLGVEIDPAAAIEVPEIRKQSQLGARKWAAARPPT